MTRIQVWAELPAELWHKILVAAAHNFLRTPGTAAINTLPAWVDWCRLAATLGSVCTSLRAAVLGPCAAHLWKRLPFGHGYPGLSADQSRSMNRLQMARCRALSAAQRVTIWGSGWDLPELQAVCKAIPAQVTFLTLNALNVEESEIISRELAGTVVTHLEVSGCTSVAFPASTRRLCFQNTSLESPHDHLAQIMSQQHFTRVLPLRALEVLRFCSRSWVMTSVDVQLIKQQLPVLRRLDLMLHSWPVSSSDAGPAQSSQRSIGSLRQLTGVQISLSVCVHDQQCALSLLEQVKDVPLRALHFMSRAAELTPSEEALLAQCTSCQQLVLLLRDPSCRLLVPPEGVDVQYFHVGRHNLF